MSKIIIIDDCQHCPHCSNGSREGDNDNKKFFKCLHPDVHPHDGAYLKWNREWTPPPMCPLPNHFEIIDKL